MCSISHIPAQIRIKLDIIEGMAKAWQRSGDVGKNIHQSLADGDITQDEIDAVTNSIYLLMRDLFSIRQRMIEMKD